MILRLDGIKYDIYEGKDWIGGFKSETKIGSKCFSNFKSKNNIGYADVLYYELTVLSGLKHSVQDYKYKDKIYIAVVETYKDSNGKTYKVQKKINAGAYIQYKNTKFTMAHLTHGNAGQLISVEGAVFNNSDFTITIKDLKLYKSMSYSNANVKGDDYELDKEAQAGEHIDTVGGERTEPFKVWGSLAFTHSHMPNYEYLYKEGNTEWWSTLDYWTLDLQTLIWYANGQIGGSSLINEIYTDKFQLCKLNDDGTFELKYRLKNGTMTYVDKGTYTKTKTELVLTYSSPTQEPNKVCTYTIDGKKLIRDEFVNAIDGTRVTVKQEFVLK